MRVRSFAASLTRGNHFPYKIEPSAIEVASVLNRSVLERLALFVRINAELLQQPSERRGIDQISLGGEILAEDAATFFSEAVL